MSFVLALWTLFGHGFLWIGTINRLHAIPLPRKIVKRTSALFFTFMGLGAAFFLAGFTILGTDPITWPDSMKLGNVGRLLWIGYLGTCWLAGTFTAVRWIWLLVFFRRSPRLLRSSSRSTSKLTASLSTGNVGENAHHSSVFWPGNQSLQLDVVTRSVELPRLPPGLDGFTVLHLSDTHFTGKIGKAYFREVVRASNALKPDLIALTGDYVDRKECIEWIPDTLGQLSAPYGVYYVLGNHDTYLDTQRLRTALDGSGLISLGGQSKTIEKNGATLVLLGNERPWFPSIPDLSRCPPSSLEGGPLRIALAHTPDQIDWARENEIDLMLCGHTHGGQIRFPGIGAILTPSYHGVKFDRGLFHLPPTILHVTQGVSGKQPLRWNCSPEIVLLSLHAKKE